MSSAYEKELSAIRALAEKYASKKADYSRVLLKAGVTTKTGQLRKELRSDDKATAFARQA